MNFLKTYSSIYLDYIDKDTVKGSLFYGPSGNLKLRDTFEIANFQDVYNKAKYVNACLHYPDSKWNQTQRDFYNVLQANLKLSPLLQEFFGPKTEKIGLAGIVHLFCIFYYHRKSEKVETFARSFVALMDWGRVESDFEFYPFFSSFHDPLKVWSEGPLAFIDRMKGEETGDGLEERDLTPELWNELGEQLHKHKKLHDKLMAMGGL